MRSAIDDVLDGAKTVEDDTRLLRAVVAAIDDAADEANDAELDARAAFADMLERVERTKAPLTERQRGWLRSVAERHGVDDERDLNLVSRGLVPRGREVETPAVLRRENLPMKPLGRGNR